MNHETIEEPAKQDLETAMRWGILSNPKGEAIVIHDKPIEDPLLWVAYETSTGKVALVYVDGRYQELGVKLTGEMLDNLIKCGEIALVQVVNKQLGAHQKATFVVQDY